MRVYKNNRLAGKKIAIASGIALLLLLSYGGLSYSQSWWPFSNDNSASISEEDKPKAVNEVNYDPPTQEEIDRSQDGKKNSAANEQIDSRDEKDANSSKNTVSIGIAFADVVGSNLEIRAFTPSVIEGDGKCTATLSKGSESITESSSAFIDSTTSQCQPIIIPTNKLKQSGSWSLIVKYDSSTSRGISDNIGVVIP